MRETKLELRCVSPNTMSRVMERIEDLHAYVAKEPDREALVYALASVCLDAAMELREHDASKEQGIQDLFRQMRAFALRRKRLTAVSPVEQDVLRAFSYFTNATNVTVSELASMINNLDRSTLTFGLKSLIRKGQVTMRRDGPGTTGVYRLTADGVKRLDELRQGWNVQKGALVMNPRVADMRRTNAPHGLRRK